MDFVLGNESDALCQDCSQHNDTDCTDWINILDEEEIDQLLESCPESCSFVSECLNATQINLLPAASTSYLDEAPSDTSSDLGAIAVLSTIGLVSVVLVGFLMIRYQGISKCNSKDFIPDQISGIEDQSHDTSQSESPSQESLENERESPSQESLGNEHKEKLQGGKRVLSIAIGNSAEANEIAESDDLPTPRLLPELNLSRESDSSDSSVKECETSATESNVSFGKFIISTPLAKIHPIGSNGDDMRSPFEESVISPSDSISHVHLLGALRSYEDDSDCSPIKIYEAV